MSTKTEHKQANYELLLIDIISKKCLIAAFIFHIFAAVAHSLPCAANLART